MRSTLPRTSSAARGLRVVSAASLALSAIATSAPARANGPAPPPGQKPPCVPATNYMLGYDCGLFPLPAGAAPAAVAVPVAVGAAVPAAAATPAVVAVAPESAASPATSSDTSAAPSHVPAYISFAVGAGGIGMTVAFGILALSAKSTLSKDCTNGNCPASDSTTVSNLKLYDNMADVGLGVAAAGVITGVILFITERPSSTSSAQRHVEPWIGLGQGGLRGSF